MTSTKTMAALAISLLAASAASADEIRYTIERTPDGFVRMDNETGAMSFCVFEGDQLICRMAVDDRVAYDEDIAELEDRVAALEQRLDSGLSQALKGLPSEQEFAQTLSYMERFMRRFMGIVEDFSTDEAAEPMPDRT